MNRPAPAMRYSPSFEHVPAALLPSDPNMYWQLTEEEKTLVTQLTQIYQATVIGERHVNLCSTDSVFTCCDQVMTAVRQMTTDMVTFFTAVRDFTSLHHEDQAAALSANGMSLFLIRNAFAASLNPDPVRTPFATALAQQTDSSATASKGCTTQRDDLGRRLLDFQNSLRPILRDDLATAVILQCVVLFDSRAPGVCDRQAVNVLQDKYLILLKHYVESQCSYLFSWHYLEAMFALIKQCRHLAASLSTDFSGWGSILEPLVHRLGHPELRTI